MYAYVPKLTFIVGKYIINNKLYNLGKYNKIITRDCHDFLNIIKYTNLKNYDDYLKKLIELNLLNDFKDVFDIKKCKDLGYCIGEIARTNRTNFLIYIKSLNHKIPINITNFIGLCALYESDEVIQFIKNNMDMFKDIGYVYKYFTT